MKPHVLFAALVIGALAVAALLAPLLPLPDPTRMQVAMRFGPIGTGQWLGRDEFGRDVLSRLIWGARTSLFVATVSALISCAAGVTLGLVGGYLGGVVEMMTQRFADLLLSIPPILVAMLIVTLYGGGTTTLILVLALLYIPNFTRVTYGGVMRTRSLEYVDAMRSIGARPLSIMFRTILPNIAGPIIVQFSLAVAAMIILESGLSFLGLGVTPPTPTWGLMISAARTTMGQTPLLLLWPCLALATTILCMNAICDALRDNLDSLSGSGIPAAGAKQASVSVQ